VHFLLFFLLFVVIAEGLGTPYLPDEADGYRDLALDPGAPEIALNLARDFHFVCHLQPATFSLAVFACVPCK
jgi:hypothetical protein